MASFTMNSAFVVFVCGFVFSLALAQHNIQNGGTPKTDAQVSPEILTASGPGELSKDSEAEVELERSPSGSDLTNEVNPSLLVRLLSTAASNQNHQQMLFEQPEKNPDIVNTPAEEIQPRKKRTICHKCKKGGYGGGGGGYGGGGYGGGYGGGGGGKVIVVQVQPQYHPQPQYRPQPQYHPQPQYYQPQQQYHPQQSCSVCGGGGGGGHRPSGGGGGYSYSQSSSSSQASSGSYGGGWR